MKAVVLFVSALLLLQACDSSDTVSSSVVESVSGVVEANGSPLPNAAVTAMRDQTVLGTDVTDSAGMFAIDGFSAAEEVLMLRIEHADFESLEVSYEDFQLMPDRTLHMPSQQDTCCGPVSIVVRDSASNDVLELADVWLRNGSTTYGRETTDSTGTVVFPEVCAGEYEVRIHVEGRSVIEHVFAVDSCDSLELEFLMLDDCCSGTAEFSLVDSENEEPVQGALVKLWKNGVVVATKETNNEGKASFFELCQGGYGVDIVADGYKEKEMTFELGCAQDKSFTASLQQSEEDTCCNGLVYIVVKDEQGEAVREAKVRLWKSGSLVEYLYTNENGLVVFDGVCEGFYGVDAIWDNQEFGVEFEVPCNGEIERTITVEDNEECCDNVLLLNVLDAESEEGIREAKIQVWENGKKIRTVYTNESGFKALGELCKGDYWIDIIREGYEAQEFRVEFDCNDTLEITKGLVESSSEECCTGVMKLIVRDSENESRIQNAEVKISSEGTVVEVLQSNADGIVIFDGLCAPRTYAVRIAKDGYDVQEFTWTLKNCEPVQETIWMKK